MLNPIIPLDYPDPDVIRVGNKYYMVTTSMYFMPGCEILESDDLINWSHTTYVYDMLEDTPKENLTDPKGAYGKGMWAASIRFHGGMYYICFVANDTGKTYLYTSKDIMGQWEKKNIEGFYHDASLLFDDDDKVYIAYGNTKIYLTELKDDLSGPKPGGFHKCIVEEKGEFCLGYEGSHLYKINGIYYIFLIHAPSKDRFFRTEAMFMTKSLKEPFVGGDVFAEDISFRGSGVAQGGIVDTPNGDWYGILFQDRGAAGRFPVLVPVTFEDGKPVFGDHGKMKVDWKPDFVIDGYVNNTVTNLLSSDDFRNSYDTTKDQKTYGSFGLKSAWQFNHNPDPLGFMIDPKEGFIRFTHQTVVDDLLLARNTLTQRMAFPVCHASVTLDASNLENGDVAGLCALQSLYGFVGIKRENENFYLIMQHRIKDGDAFVTEVCDKIPLKGAKVRLSLEADFTDSDQVCFFYEENGVKKAIGPKHALFFTLDHFTGTRAGLFSYATKKTGGYAQFYDFMINGIC